MNTPTRFTTVSIPARCIGDENTREAIIVDPGDDPSRIANYKKVLRDTVSGNLGAPIALPVRTPTDKRTLNIVDLASKGNAHNSAEFGFTMIGGAEKIRFIKSV